MKKLFSVFVLSIATLFSVQAAADDVSNTIQDFRSSPDVNAFFGDAYGYAVFPTVGKGGFGIGGAYGEGVVFKSGKRMGETNLVQLSFGFQAGGQAYSQIVFLQDKRAYDKFTSGNFEFSAQASAVAITVGASAKASTGGNTAGTDEKHQTGHYVNGMAVFTYAKGGLMYEAALGGQKFNYTPY
ncbi:YSC84-related protein [Motilimonas pumila]|uniref:Ysc84 actin-binding domain-containing protein n=1 Tax=Motilimonas pumila TaxID=2303987 RepID=A0A418YFM7_9GAMM|nr:lipid-binding SYLF domain-containing protein [Motilimonas pumila]RJG48180.1 hypothetical protein D1Z90_08930 [Motilimonas pumila]